MKKRKTISMALIGKAMSDLAIVLFTLVAGTVLWAVVLTVLWGWFIVPLGVQGINAAQAVGLSVVVAMFKRPSDPDLKNGIVVYCIHAFVVGAVSALSLLGLGGLAYLFV